MIELQDTRSKSEERPGRDASLYTFADLAKYSFRQRLVIRSAGLALFWLIRAIGWTLKYEVIGSENHVEGVPLIYVTWHNRIPTATHFWRKRGIVVMSSHSFDSEYIARFIQRFGFGTAKGSSTRGSRAALIQMTRLARSGKNVALTVDGPSGPLYEVKPGVILIAARSGVEILPFSISLDRRWELPSWDRIQIPKPFSRAVVVIGERLTVSDTSDAGQTRMLGVLQQSLIELRERSDAAVS